MGPIVRFLRTAMLSLIFVLPGVVVGPAQAATKPVSCPSGHHFSRPDGACIATQTPTCANRSSWDSARKQCVTYRKPNCPGGYHYVSNGAACAPNSSGGGPPPPPGSGASSNTVPTTCPPGFAFSVAGHQCRSTTASSPPGCAASYTYDPGRGLCLSKEAASCPSGYRLDVVHGVCSTGAVAQ